MFTLDLIYYSNFDQYLFVVRGLLRGSPIFVSWIQSYIFLSLLSYFSFRVVHDRCIQQFK